MSYNEGHVVDLKRAKIMLQSLNQDKADMIVVEETTPAAVLSFPDGAKDQPMKLEVAVEPVQDLHGYDHPWPAGCGKNLIPDTITLESGTYGSAGNLYPDENKVRSNTYIPVEASTQYVISCSSGTFSLACFYTDSNVFIERTFSSQFTTPANCSKITFVINSTDTTIKVQLEKGSTPTSYAPYSNICPISGWTGANVTRTGKNLFNKIAAISNRYIDRFNNIASSGGWNVSDYIPVVGGKNLVLSGFNGATGYSTGVCWYDEKKQYISGIAYLSADPVTFTVSNSAKFVRISFNGSSTNTLQLEYGTTPTAYDSGAKVYNISFPTPPGTVYGGTLTVNEDGSGTLVVDKVFFELLGKTFAKASSGNGRFEFVPSTNNMPNTAGGDKYIICSHLRTTSVDWSGTGAKVRINGSNKIFFQTGDADMDTIEKFNAWLVAQNTAETPVTACYEIATPQSYSLTVPQVKTLLGVNNIWTDTGDILSVEYPADTKLYTDQQIAEKVSASQRLMELIVTANREDTMTATKAYSSGDLLIVNGTLYKATTSIANGANLTVNTNVTATTVADELAALA